MHDPSSSSSSSSASHTTDHYVERLDQLCSELALLPEELCPASRPSSPRLSVASGSLSETIMDAVNAAGGDPTDPKWGHVSRLVKLRCTSRASYTGAAPGVRVGDTREVTIHSWEWMLPDTEEAWREYEQNWERRTRAHFNKKGKTSKYWPQPSDEPLEEDPTPLPSLGASKYQKVQEMVTTWQATVSRSPVEDTVAFKSVKKGKLKKQTGNEKGKAVEASVSQSSLGFSVVKRSGVANSKPDKNAVSISQTSPGAAHKSMSPVAIRPPTPTRSPLVQQVTESEEADKTPLVLEIIPPNEEPRIDEMSEMSFLPPSFPSQLRTSTQHASDRADSALARHKPAPIPFYIPPSSPLSSPPPTLQMLAQESNHTPDRPLLSPITKHDKRSRPESPPRSDAMDISSHGVSYLTPPAKRACVDPEPSSSPPPPPSTSPPVVPSSTNVSMADPEDHLPSSQGNGLGNAKGLPVPTTPDKLPLPDLRDLLASSRRSKPRPRPPSRRAAARQTPLDKAQQMVADMGAQGMPALDDDREPSPARTYLSSPASGSSDDSPQSLRFRPRSPVSPLFSQNPGAFAPRFVSSQPRHAHGGFLGVGSYGSAQTGIPLARGSSGFFGVYSSQFDVEGQVGRVSELLDQDVDYGTWLRDIPETEEQG